MALLFPLEIFDGVCRCYGFSSGFDEASSSSSFPHSQSSQNQFANIIVNNASLIDLFRLKRVSKTFQKAAERRLASFTRIDVRIYDGLAELRNHKCKKDAYEWHPHANVMLMETGQGHIGIAIDTKMKSSDVKALFQLLAAFRYTVEELYMDCPIIEILVAQINKQQVNLLIEMLKTNRKFHGHGDSSHQSLATLPTSGGAIPGPFFPILKKLTITSKSNQLEHLSRLITYAVGVDFLYETQNIDLLCLKICFGGQWCQKRNVRMFRHVNRFRQWTEADTLGERYFQQFSGTNKTKSSHRN